MAQPRAGVGVGARRAPGSPTGGGNGGGGGDGVSGERSEHEGRPPDREAVDGLTGSPGEAHDAIDDDRMLGPPRTGMRGHRLEAKQEAAILALLSQPSIARAAEAAKVGLRTLHRWINEDEAFIAAYRRARRDVFGHAVALTQRYAAVAVQTLARVMTDATAPHASRVSAATALLRFGREGIELEDLEERVKALEARHADEEPWRRSLP